MSRASWRARVGEAPPSVPNTRVAPVAESVRAQAQDEWGTLKRNWPEALEFLGRCLHSEDHTRSNPSSTDVQNIVGQDVYKWAMTHACMKLSSVPKVPLIRHVRCALKQAVPKEADWDVAEALLDALGFAPECVTNIAYEGEPPLLVALDWLDEAKLSHGFDVSMWSPHVEALKSALFAMNVPPVVRPKFVSQSRTLMARFRKMR